MVQATDQLNAVYLSDALDRTGFGSVLAQHETIRRNRAGRGAAQIGRRQAALPGEEYGRNRVVAEAGDVLDAAVRD